MGLCLLCCELLSDWRSRLIALLFLLVSVCMWYMKQKSSNKRESWNLFSKNSSFKQSRTSLWKTWPGSSPFRKRFWTKERSLLLGTEGITLQNTSPVIWYSFLVSIGRHSPDGCGVTVPTPCILGSARIPRQPNVVQSHGWWIMVFPVHRS